jgi:hypothetical protein
MADKFTHMSSYKVKLTDLLDDTYSLAVSLKSSSITLAVETITEVSNVSSVDTVDVVSSIQTVNTISEIVNVSSLDTVDKISSIDTISIINSVITLTEVTNIRSLDTVDSITNIQTLQAGTVTVVQSTHDSLNCNANIQVANSDVSTSNPVNVDVKSIIDSSMGINGGNYITTTATTTPSTGYSFFAIQAITDTVVSSVTGNIDVSSIALSAGYTIYGAWTAIKLTSGSVIAYKRVT